MTADIVVRFAPSPTGHFHVGGARTALFNYLFAKKNGGRFFLRIEDTDQTRYRPYAVQELIESLAWLGIDWSDGPSKEELVALGVDAVTADQYGKTGGFVQSTRKELYKTHAQMLCDVGKAYKVFADESVEEGVKFSKASKQMGLDTWRNASAFMVRKAEKAELPYHIRLKMPREGIAFCKDLLRGEIEFSYYRLHDPVLLKTDGMPTYHLASVVDDHAMNVTHIIRNEEWLPSLPFHYYLYSSFNWIPPVFVHTASILNPSGKGKMSKRETVALDGKTVVPSLVLQYKHAGFLPEAMINFMALTGWNPGLNKELFSKEDLITLFSLKRLGMTGAAWDYSKLKKMNSVYIQKLDVDTFVSMAKQFI